MDQLAEVVMSIVEKIRFACSGSREKEAALSLLQNLMFERDWTGLEWDTMYALGSTPLRQIHLRRDKRRKHTIERLCYL